MAKNVAIDDTLIEKAVELGHHKSKKDAVTEALIQYIQRIQQQKIIDLFGKVDIDTNYTYKQE